MKKLSRAGFILAAGLAVSGIQTGASHAGVITQNVAFKQVTLLAGFGGAPLPSLLGIFPPDANDTILVFDTGLGDLQSVEININGTMSVSANALIPLANFPSSSSEALFLSSHYAQFSFGGLSLFSNTVSGRTATCSGVLSCTATLPAVPRNISASTTFNDSGANQFLNAIDMGIISFGLLTTSFPAGITGRLVVTGTLEIKYNYTSLAPGSGEGGTTSEGGGEVPEPGTLGLLIAGFTGLGVIRRRRRTRAFH